MIIVVITSIFMVVGVFDKLANQQRIKTNYNFILYILLVCVNLSLQILFLKVHDKNIPLKNKERSII